MVAYAVDKFCRTVTPLVAVQQRGRMTPAAVEEAVGSEALSLALAFIDLDGRATDSELEALIGAFAVRLPKAGLPLAPNDLRATATFAGRSQFLWTPSPIFDLLAAVDSRDGSSSAKAYVDGALGIADSFVSLDPHPSPDALAAVDAYRRKLVDGLVDRSLPPMSPGDGPSAREVGRSPGTTVGTRQPVGNAQSYVVTPTGPPEPLADLLAELDAMIGLDEVKEVVGNLTDLLRVGQLRKQHGLPVVETVLHQVFVGNPGTGKTTVARLLGRIFRTLGVVATGQLVETDRAGLVAGYEGQTAALVTQRFDEADGGLLFIDEAYSLVRGQEGFGQEAIDAVVKLMEDRRDRVVVIVAGYPDEMARFISSNPGLASRFARTVEFTDYDSDDLVRIFQGFATRSSYRLDDAVAALGTYFAGCPREKGFGNGRHARRLFEAVVTAQAGRVVVVESPSTDVLVRVTAADLAAAIPAVDD
jgi:hypothetical protein